MRSKSLKTWCSLLWRIEYPLDIDSAATRVKRESGKKRPWAMQQVIKLVLSLIIVGRVVVSVVVMQL